MPVLLQNIVCVRNVLNELVFNVYVPELSQNYLEHVFTNFQNMRGC